MTLNGVMAVTLRYFTKFGKHAFQLITASSSIELIDQKSASITHRVVKLVCVTKFMHSWVDTKLPVNQFSYLLLIYCLSFTLLLHFVAYSNVLTLGFRLIFFCSHYNYAVLCSMGVQCSHHQF